MARVIEDETIAILNAWMEARGEGLEGLTAVCEVMRNRLKDGRWGKSYVDVCLAPYQFSGWNSKDPNRIAALKLDQNSAGYQLAKLAWDRSAKTDLTHGALYYYNPKAADPAWAKDYKLVALVGNHKFYREK